MHIIYEPLDERIAPIVHLLREHGVDTFASCEGGYPNIHDFPYPCVRLYPSQGRTMKDEETLIAKILSSGGHSGYYIKHIFHYQSKSIRWHGEKDFMEIEFWVSPIKDIKS